MARKVAIGIKIITEDYFYVDKTDFIREWWEIGKLSQYIRDIFVISLSFANVEETNYKTTSYRICEITMEQVERDAFSSCV